MSEISLFNFEGNEIRYVGDGVQHEWVAKDVCAALHPTANPANLNSYLKSVNQKRKGNKIVITLGGEQSVITLLEAGLYELLSKSRSKAAERFQDWLYEEVLPSIRKTGTYSFQKTDSAPESKPLQLPPADVRIRDYANAMQYLEEKLGIDLQNPRMQQHYQDVINNIVLDGQKQLPHSGERWMGIVEFAETLGYRVTPKQAGPLGKCAKAWFVETTGKAPYEERRLVNGRMCPVKLYNVTVHGEGLSEVVREYLGEPEGSAAA